MNLSIVPHGTILPMLAYLGPGLGVGAIAVVLGFFASILLAIFAVLWYPFKRLFTRRKKTTASETMEDP